MSNFIKKFFFERRKALRLLFFMSADVFFIALSVFLAFFVRFEAKIPSHYLDNILTIIPLFLAVTLPIFYFSKLYYFTWIYVSTTELIALTKATSLSFLLLTASFVLLKDSPLFSGFPRSTLFISYFFIFVFCGGIRFAKRIFLQILPQMKKEDKERTLIAGAGDAGEQILRNILSSQKSPFLPVGFADDNPSKQGILIHGLKVLGKISDIPEITKQNRIEGLIIALPSVGAKVISQAAELGRKAGLKKIRITPSFDEIINGKFSISNLREVEMEDLLGREPVVLDQKAIENFIQGKSVLITGAAGSIGSELSRQLAKFSPGQLLILDQDETGIFNISEELKSNFPKLSLVSFVADIRDKEKIGRIFKKYQPSVIFHAAAYKHVPLMEEHSDEAVKNNILGTKILVDTALNCGAEKLIFISTDKAVNPTSIMGTTKRIGEMICQSSNQEGRTKFISVRFGNVLNSRGSVIPIFQEQIKKGGPVEITHPEMKRYFMTTPEACLLVLQAGAMGQGGEVFVLDMGGPIKIIDLAKELIRLSGLEPDKDIPIVFTEPRPGEKFFEEILLADELRPSSSFRLAKAKVEKKKSSLTSPFANARMAEEGTETTQSQKIFRVKLKEVEGVKFNFGLEKLEKAAYNGEKEEIVAILKEIIPNYKPNG